MRESGMQTHACIKTHMHIAVWTEWDSTLSTSSHLQTPPLCVIKGTFLLKAFNWQPLPLIIACSLLCPHIRQRRQVSSSFEDSSQRALCLVMKGTLWRLERTREEVTTPLVIRVKRRATQMVPITACHIRVTHRVKGCHHPPTFYFYPIHFYIPWALSWCGRNHLSP